MLLTDDPTDEIGAAWGVKEQLRIVLACITLAAARKAKTRFDILIGWADLPEADRLLKTINAWWKEIEVFICQRTRETARRRTRSCPVADMRIAR